MKIMVVGGGGREHAIIKKIRESCGDDFIISVRTAGIEPDVETAIGIAEEYVKAGCDYLQVST